jgi:hypothetical protein
MMDIISGEKLQELADAYCGLPEDFSFNPRIGVQQQKHINLQTLDSSWDNPHILFCYSHRLHLFGQKLKFLSNSCILITHNSDGNITEDLRYVVDNDKIIRMYSQNVMIEHPKLHLIPIGIANSMWPHGNIAAINTVISSQIPKNKDVYFYFNVSTNRKKREECRRIIEQKGVAFGNNLENSQYLQHLAEHKFAICPDGNGIDSHRIWECLYLGVIPIVNKNMFTTQLQKNYPCIVLDSWEDYNHDEIMSRYESLSNELACIKNTLNFSYYDSLIKNGCSFDIVIPVGPSDYNRVMNQLTFTKKNIIGYRRIFILTNTAKNTEQIEGCKIIDESTFPFTLESIAEIHGKNTRNGWYLQQLLKLYAGIIVPNILPKYLVIDADTYFLKPTTFINNEQLLYNPGSEYHIPYFEHMKQLHPTLVRKINSLSGISHHMIFDTQYVYELMKLVENSNDGPFWKIFLQKVDSKHYLYSGASEYEIYFNFMLEYHYEAINIRLLKWENVSSIPENTELNYVSCHWYMRA